MFSQRMTSGLLIHDIDILVSLSITLKPLLDAFRLYYNHDKYQTRLCNKDMKVKHPRRTSRVSPMIPPGGSEGAR